MTTNLFRSHRPTGRRKRTKLPLVAPLIALLTMVVVGCGGSAGTPYSATQKPAGPSSAVLADLAPSGKLRVAVHPPFLAQKDPATGAVVVSRLDMANLEAIARGTGGRAFRLTPTDPGLPALEAAIEGLEQKTLAREFSYRHKERFQIPLGIEGYDVHTQALGLRAPENAVGAAIDGL